jgi:hypothetical protein
MEKRIPRAEERHTRCIATIQPISNSFREAAPEPLAATPQREMESIKIQSNFILNPQRLPTLHGRGVS